MIRRLVVGLLVACLAAAPGRAQRTTQHVVLVTLDGMRWQEVFGGADSALLRDPRFVRDTAALRRRFWTGDAAARRAALMPFLWGTVATSGQLYGNRRLDRGVEVTNPHRVSYPGYSELLVGVHDARIKGNDKVPNPNRTVLEFVNEQPGTRGKVAVFGSWDVFPYIVAEERSRLPVNAGYRPATGTLTERERTLNVLQAEVPARWEQVRFDTFTHHYALEYLAKHRPRLLYVAYGETDDFAHDGRYDEYLLAAHRTDGFIQELWAWVQSQPDYRGRTTLVVTTDHGRGSGADFPKHGADVSGAESIWIAVLGPDTPTLGEHVAPGRVVQAQIAATVAALLGLDYARGRTVAPAISGTMTR